MLSVIGDVVIDIHQRTQTAKTLFFIEYSEEASIEKNYQTTFFSLRSLMYINNHSTYDIEICTVSFINT